MPMSILNVNICSVCGKVKTESPSGVCARCRRRQTVTPYVTCKVCNSCRTPDPTGVCSRCREKIARSQKTESKSRLCSVCKMHYTKKEDGVCNSCMKAKNYNPERELYLCSVCGQALTLTPSGICRKCRWAADISSVTTPLSEENQAILDKSIETLKQSVVILENKIAGVSFSEIAMLAGMSKNGAYNRYRCEITYARSYCTTLAHKQESDSANNSNESTDSANE